MRKIIKKGLASIYTDVPTLRAGTVEAYALAFRVRWGCYGGAVRHRSICRGR